jgi:glycosyltransferase, family 1
MKVLFLGGVFDESHNEEIISKTRTYVEYAANNFQKKIIYGFRSKNVPLDVVSIPFLGAYPTAYSDIYFAGFKNMLNDKSGYKYYNFNNIYGYRNISRYRAAKRGLREFIKYNDEQKLIVVYTPHTPFVQAANWAKRKDPRIKVCMVVPDLPQYMDLSENQSPIYKFLKSIDLKKFAKENEEVDSYILLTEQMAEALNVGKRPYKVVEGIYEEALGEASKEKDVKTIVYTGKLNIAFGALNLVKAFHFIDNPNIRLVICGSGEAKDEIAKIAAEDSRIDFRGQVSSDIARQCILDGDILVNPRPNDSVYTKYSFPSKIIDYLATGNPVVAFELDGMPKVYRSFIYYIPENTVQSMADTIKYVINEAEDEIQKKTDNAIRYINNNLSREQVARIIIDLNFE